MRRKNHFAFIAQLFYIKTASDTYRSSPLAGDKGRQIVATHPFNRGTGTSYNPEARIIIQQTVRRKLKSLSR